MFTRLPFALTSSFFIALLVLVSASTEGTGSSGTLNVLTKGEECSFSAQCKSSLVCVYAKTAHEISDFEQQLVSPYSPYRFALRKRTCEPLQSAGGKCNPPSTSCLYGYTAITDLARRRTFGGLPPSISLPPAYILPVIPDVCTNSVPPCNDNNYCSESDDVDEDGFICVPKKKIGEIGCTPNYFGGPGDADHCMSGSYCDTNGEPPYTCQPVNAEGQACRRDVSCDQGLYCTGPDGEEGICAKRKGLNGDCSVTGDQCATDLRCLDGSCQKAKRGFGETCSASFPCEDGLFCPNLFFNSVGEIGPQTCVKKDLELYEECLPFSYGVNDPSPYGPTTFESGCKEGLACLYNNGAPPSGGEGDAIQVFGSSSFYPFGFHQCLPESGTCTANRPLTCYPGETCKMFYDPNLTPEDSPSYVCEGLPKSDTYCRSFMDCAASSRGCDSSTNMCKTPVAYGYACSSSADCGFGLRCGESGTCMDGKAAGAACVSDVECKSKACNRQVCQPVSQPLINYEGCSFRAAKRGDSSVQYKLEEANVHFTFDPITIYWRDNKMYALVTAHYDGKAPAHFMDFNLYLKVNNKNNNHVVDKVLMPIWINAATKMQTFRKEILLRETSVQNTAAFKARVELRATDDLTQSKVLAGCAKFYE